MNRQTSEANHAHSRALTAIAGSSKQWTHRNNPVDFARRATDRAIKSEGALLRNAAPSMPSLDGEADDEASS